MTDTPRTKCRAAFVNNNPDAKVYQPFSTGDFTVIGSSELAELEANLKSALDHIKKDDIEIADLNTKLAEAEKIIRIAAGCISVAYPHFHSKHPQDVIDWLTQQAIDKAL